MKIKKEVAVRKVAGETMLIPIGGTVGEYNGIFTLTETAAVAFEALNRGENEEGIVNAVLAEFDIDRKTAVEDVADFLEQLSKFGII